MKFLGREHEIRCLRDCHNGRNAALSVIYGRRRIGKTRLVEEAFPAGRHRVWKFEGIEGEGTAFQQRQIFEDEDEDE